jgi:hypothetical protein
MVKNPFENQIRGLTMKKPKRHKFKHKQQKKKNIKNITVHCLQTLGE